MISLDSLMAGRHGWDPVNLLETISSGVLAAALASATIATEANASTPHLDAVESTLRTLSPETEGSVWERSGGNALLGSAGDWLLQTPNCWGGDDCSRPEGSYLLADTIYKSVAAAQELVDVTTLVTYPDGMFHDALMCGLRVALRENPDLKIRILAGTPPALVTFANPGFNSARGYFAELQAQLGSLADNAQLMVAEISPKWAYSWNHAKIIAVDGKSAIVGGHNLWSHAYGEVAEPISDVSMQLHGPAAISSHKFADQLWGYVCEHAHGIFNTRLARSEAVGGRCLSTEALELKNRAWAPGVSPVLALGGLGLGMHSPDHRTRDKSRTRDSRATYTGWFSDPPNKERSYSSANPDVAALRTLIASAKEKIFLSQQDLIAPCLPPFGNSRYDARLFDVLVDKLLEGVSVRIVLSTPGAKPYSEIKSLSAISDILVKKIKRRPGFNRAKAESVVCRGLQLAPIRITEGSSAWESGGGIANHAKLVMVDDQAFYIGSRNLYPTNLQEYGFIVEDAEAASDLNAEYTEPMWENSSSSAAIDFETGICDL